MSTSRTYTSLMTLPAASIADLAQGTLGYFQVVANQTTITAEVDLTSLTVTATVVAGRRIKITGFGSFFSTVTGDGARLVIQEDGSQIGAAFTGLGTTPFSSSITATILRTPTAGSHTWKLRAARDSGTGSLSLFAGSANPAFIHVEDVGI